jgi:hypothetical protein
MALRRRVGLRSRRNGFKPVQPGPPSESRPGSGDPLEGAPGVFNLAFRFNEPQADRPMPGLEPTPGYVVAGQEPTVGIGNWFESRQARTLKRPLPATPPSTGNFRADVSFARLADGDTVGVHRPRENQARIFSSSLNPHEGFRERFPSYGGRLQPYLVRVPDAGPPSRVRGLTWLLHGRGGTYTEPAVFHDNLLSQFGDERRNLVVSPLGRGAGGWYIDEAEVDFFEVWRDVARRFALDPNRVALSGYSMGGYGTYRLGVLYPDLFGRAFTVVGPPARGGWVPPAHPFDPDSGRFTEDTNSNRLLENVRWVPYLNWVTFNDELVPYAGPRAQQRRFDRLGLRSQLWSFPGEHFTLAVLDEWEAGKRHLGSGRVERTPSRVNYALMPDTWRPGLGLVHDHAHWVSDLNARNEAGDPGTNPARAEIDAISRAFGEDPSPRTARVTTARGGPPPRARWRGRAGPGSARGRPRTRSTSSSRTSRGPRSTGAEPG